MGSFRSRRHQRIARFTSVVATAGACLACSASAAEARDIVVQSFDGTQLVGAFFPAEGLKPGEKAPTVVSGHGWAGSHSTNDASTSDPAGTIGNGPLRKAGYNVLTWDARGFGASGGTASVDGPDFEGRDVSALLDFVARQPESLNDAPTDPRVGMVGSSYGGGIQLVAAGLDNRLDAIVPDIAWHSMLTSLDKDDTFKSGWGNLLFAAGVPTSLIPGLIAPTGAQSGTMDPRVTQAYVEGTTTGTISPGSRDYFASRGPGDLVKKISIPTFLTQGTPDTLFTLQEAITNYGILRDNGVQVKMLWHCGGHGVCLTNAGSEDTRIQQEVLTWFARYLKADPTAKTGPRFEWVSQDGVWHTAPDYPLPPAKAKLTAQGAGTLAIAPGPGSGGTIFASPSPIGLSTPVPAVTAGTDVVGAPKLDLTYTGTGSGSTRVFAQLVDTQTDLVAGNQATPIPVILDGRPHTISRELEAVALHLTPTSSYELQLVPATTLYREQRALGVLNVSKLLVTLPAVTIPAAPMAGTSKVRRKRAARVTLGLPGSRASKRGTRRLKVRVRVSGQSLQTLWLTVRDRAGRRLGTASARSLPAGGSRLVAVRLNQPIRHGRYRVGATFRTTSGAKGAASRSIVLG
ncbi:MAG: peptidase [Solirubrobacterales bacterium]|nr:peptidase [Solirubrobacterales bacterium]